MLKLVNILTLTYEGMRNISTVEEFVSMNTNTNPNMLFMLNNDLDFTNVNYTPFTFYGTLNGNGYTIRNMNISNYWVKDNAETFNNIYRHASGEENVVMNNTLHTLYGLYGNNKTSPYYEDV